MRIHSNIRAESGDAEYIRRTAAYWRARADEARVIAQQMRNVDGERMLDVARVYDDLAKQEEKREGHIRRT